MGQGLNQLMLGMFEVSIRMRVEGWRNGIRLFAPDITGVLIMAIRDSGKEVYKQVKNF